MPHCDLDIAHIRHNDCAITLADLSPTLVSTSVTLLHSLGLSRVRLLRAGRRGRKLGEKSEELLLERVEVKSEELFRVLLVSSLKDASARGHTRDTLKERTRMESKRFFCLSASYMYVGMNASESAA